MNPVLICLVCRSCKPVTEEGLQEWCLEHAEHGIISDTSEDWFQQMVVKAEEIEN